MKIVVKREHIDNGVALSSTSCPIALACWELGLKGVWVDGRNVQYRISDKIYVVALPPQAVEFTRTFDAGGPVAAFVFDLPPTKSVGRFY